MNTPNTDNKKTFDEPIRTQLYEYLLNSELFSIYRSSFEKVTGHTVAFIHPVVTETPSDEVQRCGNAYCSILSQHGACSRRCLSHTLKLSEFAFRSASTSKCSGNMTSTLIPVKAQDRVIAYLRTGQLKLDISSENLANLDEIQKNLPLSVAKDLKKAYDMMASTDESRYLDQLVVIGAFAIQLSGIAEKAVDHTHSDSILTDRCKRYIDKNLGDKICLKSLAEHTQVTKSYVCKQFKKHTGMTIMEYVNLHRIEKAKEILIRQKDQKIIDLAYACGFQSLSQFNRTFQKFVGSSPSSYRKNATTCASGSCVPSKIMA